MRLNVAVAGPGIDKGGGGRRCFTIIYTHSQRHICSRWVREHISAQILHFFKTLNGEGRRTPPSGPDTSFEYPYLGSSM